MKLRPDQQDVLAALKQADGEWLSVTQLAESTTMNPTRVMLCVTVLEREGLIRSRLRGAAAQHGRVYRIRERENVA